MGKSLRCDNGHMFDQRKHGDVCPYCHLNTSRVLRKPDEVSVFEELEEKDYVIGWLACIAGRSKGRHYAIVSSKNYVGSSSTMDIQILGDNAICARSHAVILHDSESCNTYVLPGESSGLVYRFKKETWEVVVEPKVLVSGARIKLGESELIFVSLCGENERFKFHWD